MHIPFFVSYRTRLLLIFSVAAHELIYTTSGVNQLRLTCVEWVRGTRNFQLEYWIGFALELNCL